MANTVGATLPEITVFAPGGTIQKGDNHKGVKLVQELLSLAGFMAVTDGDFGPATEKAVIAFSQANSISNPLGRVDLAVWRALWKPMAFALEPFLSPIVVPSFLSKNGNRSVQIMALEYAKRHLKANAHELTGNKGPWIRLFLSADPVDGTEGYAWCGGFTRFCIKQALETLGKGEGQLWTHRQGWDCDAVGKWAQAHGCFYPEANQAQCQPGTIFLIQKTPTDWIHTGFVESYDPATRVVTTLEGKTNVAGSVDGIAVMRRFRNASKTNLDFVDDYGKLASG